MLKSDEKIMIIELRNKGYGYKAIASVLKVKRDIIRDYCRSKGLTGYGKSLLVEPKSVKKVYPGSCKLCGEGINNSDRKGRKSKFCSERCRREWWSKHPEAKKRK